MTIPAYRPLGGRARWAGILLAVTIAVDVIAIGFDVWEVALIHRFQSGQDTTAGSLAGSDDRQAVMHAIAFLLFAATGIVFIRWFSWAYRNATALAGSELRFKPGWAIGAWFVPFLNLWRPKQIADEIWTTSEATPQPRETDMLSTWWACWLISAFVGNISGRVFFQADSLDDFRNSDLLDVASLVVEILAGVLAIIVVRSSTRRQARWAQSIGPAADDTTRSL